MAIRGVSYTAYGYSRVIPSLLLGFNGELRLMNLHAYALGNGHRCYSPILMRFCSPDSLSPFERGGMNAYCYCGGDPINNVDPTGRFKTGLTKEFKRLKIPMDFKGGVKEAFRKDPARKSYSLGIGEAGFLIEKSEKGLLTVSPIDGLSVTRGKVEASNNYTTYLEGRIKRLEENNRGLKDRIKGLEEQERLQAPILPSPALPPRPPKPADLSVNPISIRQPQKPD